MDQFLSMLPMLGLTGLITSVLTLFLKRKFQRAQTEGQGIKNLDQILQLNAREIKRIKDGFESEIIDMKESFDAQIKPLHQIIEELTTVNKSQRKYIDKVELECKNRMCKIATE